MACNTIKDGSGNVVAVACGNRSREWEKMCKELEERTQAQEKGNINEQHKFTRQINKGRRG